MLYLTNAIAYLWVTMVAVSVSSAATAAVAGSSILRRSKSKSSNNSRNTPIPVPFPMSFRIDFVTIVTTRNNAEDLIVANHEVGEGDGDDAWLIEGRLYYDWSQERRTQRIDHGPGSFECLHFYNHDGPCSLVFVPDWGMYRILLKKDDDTSNNNNTRLDLLDCCLDIPNIGTPPPDWAQRAKPTYNGLVHDVFSNQSAHEWIYDHLDPPSFVGSYETTTPSSSSARPPSETYHTSRQVADGPFQGRPLLFTFPSASTTNGRQDYHYLVETMVVEEDDMIDAGIFALPEGCQTRFCKCKDEDGATTFRREETASISQPL